MNSHWHRRLATLSAAVVVISSMAACGSSPSSEGTPPKTPTVSSVSPAPQTFPRTITDFRGQVTIPAKPKAVAVTNLVVLGDPVLASGYDLVAAPTLASAPKDMPYLPGERYAKAVDIGTSGKINLEALSGAKPDLIFTTDKYADILPALDKIATTVVIDSNKIAKDRFSVMKDVADALGATDKFTAFQDEYKKRTQALAAKTGGQSLTFVRLVPNAMMTYHENTPVGQLLTDSGFKVTKPAAGVGEASGGKDFIVQLSAERTDLLPGDRLLIYSENMPDADAEKLIETPLWKSVPAIQSGKFNLVTKDKTGFLLSPYGTFGTMHDVKVLEDLYGK